MMGADQPKKASRLYRGLTVPVNGEKTWSEYGARVLQLEAKATVPSFAKALRRTRKLISAF
jgi:hypothetical protein